MVNKYKKYREDYCAIEQSGLFDEEWYSNKYLKNQSTDPILHFLIFGSKNGYNPNSYFDCSWYLNKYPSVKEEGLNPFVHYIKYGRREGRFPVPFKYDLKYKFDYYDILNSGLFDEKWFIKKYSLKKNVNPIIYYLKNGVDLGLNPSPDFDTTDYLKMYPDVKKSNINPFVHYIKYGKKEGRLPKQCKFDKVIQDYYFRSKNKKTSRSLKRNSSLKRKY